MTIEIMKNKVFGVCGWKNSGKTTLVTNLITHCRQLGLRVNSIKNAHCNFTLDQAGTDSYKHLQAGSEQTMVASDSKWMLLTQGCHSLLTLDQMLALMVDVDLVIVEGLKHEHHPKLQIFGADKAMPLDTKQHNIVALVTTTAAQEAQFDDRHLPLFQRDQIAAIAQFMINY